jgi:hypothetical protein
MIEWAIAVSGPVTALVFAGLQRLFRAGAEDAARAETSQQLRGEFARFRSELLAEMDERYRRTPECVLISQGITSRLDSIDGRIKEVQDYAHERAHSLNNDLQKLARDFSAGVRTVREEG